MDKLWDDAQFKVENLIVMLTDATGSEIGKDLINVRTGRIEIAFKIGDVSIEYGGDFYKLILGSLGYMASIKLSKTEANRLAKLLEIDITILDE
ncbi:hypothetical protein Ping_0250 [Psychromonas ingrahamii 37]|uniref:Uncharacterized protein n=1 Tax=Psychromonas ingrahamii (strain DSM 17664 / CCUG 51855 / 37) TaxID=357804 RepID=A1SRK2_PSYIN|nr:hypothetical protein [Psychromonas ingrahamii]ABM02117.1 hypothetical protein Ping_0250 [Psychromonas ingrahamii 37]